ncbi:MAG: hypothetical protein ACOCRK_02705 [bacterium]
MSFEVKYKLLINKLKKYIDIKAKNNKINYDELEYLSLKHTNKSLKKIIENKDEKSINIILKNIK